MAKSRIQIRFFINMGTGNSRNATTKRSLNAAASTIVQNVAFGYADGYRDYLMQDVSKRMSRDVFAEIANAAAKYKRLVIGATGKQTRMRMGELKTAAEGGPSANPSSGVSWAPRNAKYLARKQRELGHTNWFSAWTRYMGNTLGKGQNWVEIFGPVKVAVTGGKSSGFSGAVAPHLGGRNYGPRAKEAQNAAKIRIHIGSISVTALERITPAMLSAQSKLGIPAVVAAAGYEELAHRLGGRGPYRPTLEPFLEFVLTRAIPYAVRKRVQTGLKKSIRG